MSIEVDHASGDASAAPSGGGARPDRDFLRRAISRADLDAVRIALYQHTGDAELADLPAAARLDEPQRTRLKEKAVAWLEANAGPRTLEEPAAPTLRKLMEMAVGGPMGDLEFEARRDLTAFKAFPFAVHWPGDRPSLPEGFKVAIIGSGFAGITMAVQLDLLGIPYVVIERRSEPGGVWSINRYPDVRVDTGSVTYELQFVKDHTWSEYFGRGGEVQRYLQHVSRTFGVHDKTLFNHDLKTASFDEARNVWVLEIDAPDAPMRLDANVIVSASGLFATPNMPAFEGQETFRGQIVHPAAWPADMELEGKRVAIVGNGSTGVQMLGAVARQAEHVCVFQRTPQWISPRENYGAPLEPEVAWLVKNFPGYWNWWRFTSTAPLFDTHDLMLADEAWQAAGGKVNPKSDAMRETLTAYIEQETGGRTDLIDRLIPDYAPFARRPVVDNGWYRALTRDNVELVTEPVERLVPEGVATRDGKVRELDVIVSATGYDVAKYLWPTRYIGRDGVDLHDSWSQGDGPRAYIGMMAPKFPNLFILYGPNSQPISGGPAQPVWFAVWASFVARGLMKLIEQGASRIEVKQDAFTRYNTELDAEASKLVQMSAAGGVTNNYYVNREYGRLQVNAPWYSPHYHHICTNVNWSDLALS